LYSVFFPNANNGYAVGGNGTILMTKNGGTDWTAQPSGTIGYLIGVCFTDVNTGYVSGQGGTILKTINGGFPVGIKEREQQANLHINPNPANEKITIGSSESASPLDGTLSVFGLDGAALIKQQVKGSSVDLNIGSFPAGIYFIRIMNHEKTVTGKFIKN
jgi:hypothetical protein